MKEENNSNLSKVELSQLVPDYYLHYASGYMLGRAIPFVADGLKPVHRRVVFCSSVKNPQNTLHKCAEIVGETIGKYHPHGDSAVYESLIRLAQPWNTSYPLFEIHGNKGNIDGDGPAAMRYTECKLTDYAQFLLAPLKKIDDDSIWQQTEMQNAIEPRIIPALIPNILLNGSTGISAKSVEIPPFNAKEVVVQLKNLLNNKPYKNLYPDFTPFFEQGTYLYLDRENLKNLNETGDSVMYEYAKIINTPDGLDVVSLPYNTKALDITNSIIDLSSDKTNPHYIDGISSIVNNSGVDKQTNKYHFLLHITTTKGANKQQIIQKLYDYTGLKSRYHAMINTIGQDNNSEKLYSIGIKQVLTLFLQQALSVLRKMFEKQLKQYNKDLNLKEGLIRLHTDKELLTKIIAMVQKSHGLQEVVDGLIKFGFNLEQATYIAKLQLYQLNKDETDTWMKQVKELKAEIKRINEILTHQNLLNAEYEKILDEFINKFGRKRTTTILEHDLVANNQADHPIFNTKEMWCFNRDGSVSLSKNKLTQFEFEPKQRLLIITKQKYYYNWLENDNYASWYECFGTMKPELYEIFKYDENKILLVITQTNAKLIRLKDIKNRGKYDTIIDDKSKLMVVKLIDQPNDWIIQVKNSQGELSFNASDIPFGVKGSGGVLIKQKDLLIDDVKVIPANEFKGNLRKRGYVLK